MCATCMVGAQRSQKRELELPELESWMVASHHVGARNQAPASMRVTSALNH